MSNGITLQVENGIESLPSDKVTRESPSGQSATVDVVEVDSADEMRTGGVVVRFEDGSKVEVESAELVGVF